MLARLRWGPMSTPDSPEIAAPPPPTGAEGPAAHSPSEASGLGRCAAGGCARARVRTRMARSLATNALLRAANMKTKGRSPETSVSARRPVAGHVLLARKRKPGGAAAPQGNQGAAPKGPPRNGCRRRRKSAAARQAAGGAPGAPGTETAGAEGATEEADACRTATKRASRPTPPPMGRPVANADRASPGTRRRKGRSRIGRRMRGRKPGRRARQQGSARRRTAAASGSKDRPPSAAA